MLFRSERDKERGREREREREIPSTGDEKQVITCFRALKEEDRILNKLSIKTGSVPKTNSLLNVLDRLFPFEVSFNTSMLYKIYKKVFQSLLSSVLSAAWFRSMERCLCCTYLHFQLTPCHFSHIITLKYIFTIFTI